MQTIEAYAFSGCTGFTGSLVIPDSVTQLGIGSFLECGFTDDLTIGNGLTVLNDKTFWHCSFQGHLSLGDQLQDLGSMTFEACPFTGTLTIPGGVSRLESGVFAGCRFTALNLPDSVTYLADTAFNGRTGLPEDDDANSIADVYYYGIQEDRDNISNWEINLPEVENKRVWHFLESEYPISIHLAGPDWVYLGESMTLTAVIHPRNATNKRVTWYSNRPEVADVVNGQVVGHSKGIATITATTVNGLEAAIGVEVRDNTGRVYVCGSEEDAPLVQTPLSNATVTIEGITKTTDAEGWAEFLLSELPSGAYSFNAHVACGEDYFEKTSQVFFVDGYENNVNLVKKGDGIYFKQVTLINAGERLDLLRDHAMTTMLPYTYAIRTENGEEEIVLNESTYPLLVLMDWNKHPRGTVTLTGLDSGHVVQLNADGTTHIPLAMEFLARERIRLTATTVDDAGNEVTAEKILPVQIHLPIKLVVPPSETISTDSLYLLEGLGIKLNLGNIQASDTQSGSSNVSFKNGVLKLTFDGKDDDKRNLGIFDDSIGGDGGLTKGSKSTKVTLTGMIQIPLTDPKGGLWSGEIKAATSTGIKATTNLKTEREQKEEMRLKLFDHTYNFLLNGVTCYIDTSLSAGGLADLKIFGPYNKVNFTGTLEGNGGATVGGGIGGGIGGTQGDNMEMKVGIEGALDLRVPMSLTLTSEGDVKGEINPSIKGSVRGKASIKAWIIDLTQTIELGSVTWDKDGVHWSSIFDPASTFSLDTRDWKFIGRDYLKNRGGFTGGIIPLAEQDQRVPAVVQANILPCADAVVTDLNGTPCLLYITDDLNRDVFNNARAAYCTWTGNGWSDPSWLDSSSETVDFALAVDGIFTAWEDASQVLTDRDNVASALAATEVSVGVWNGSDYTITQLTDDDLYDHSVKVSASPDGQTAMAAWLTVRDSDSGNSSIDLTGANGVTSISYSIYTGSEWSTPKTLVSGIGAVTNLYLSYNGSVGTISYKECGSGNLNVVSTDEVTSGTVVDNVGRYAVDGSLLAYFDEEKVLHIWENGSEIQSFPTEYKGGENPVIASYGGSASVFWLEPGGIFYTSYLDGTWSGRLCLQSDNALLQGLSCRMTSAENFLVSYLRTEEDVTDLMALNTWSAGDLTALDVTADSSLYVQSGIVDFTLSLFNNGEKAIENSTVSIYEGEKLVYINTIPDMIQPGAYYDFSGQFSPGDSGALHDYTVTVSANGDCHSGNNSAWFSVGVLDTTIEDAFFETDWSTGTEILQVLVSNQGSVDVENALLRVYQDSMDTAPLYEKSVVLNGNTMAMISLPETQDHNAVYYLSLETENDENTFNNLYLIASEDAIPPLDANLTDDCKLTVSVNTDLVPVSGAIVIISVRDASGRMQQIYTDALDTAIVQEGRLTTTRSLDMLPEGGQIQIMLVDSSTLAPRTAAIIHPC
ncbi:MAG: leucine-rich repeat protein [Candidatus Pararuminococcus gallinarum]